MNKKEKLYLLAFVLSYASLASAVVLKMCGVSWFNNASPGQSDYSVMEYIIQAFVLIVQGFIMLGCMTWLPPNKLIKKYIIFIPINAIPLLFSSTYGLYISFGVFAFMAALTLPKLSTIPKFMLAVAVITIVQNASMWVKYSLLNMDTLNADAMTFLIGNIDQFILLSLYYYIVMKWGDKLVELVFLRKRH